MGATQFAARSPGETRDSDAFHLRRTPSLTQATLASRTCRTHKQNCPRQRRGQWVQLTYDFTSPNHTSHQAKSTFAAVNAVPPTVSVMVAKS